jgi:hypothetical protein
MKVKADINLSTGAIKLSGLLDDQIVAMLTLRNLDQYPKEKIKAMCKEICIELARKAKTDLFCYKYVA